jgi:anti-sigma-K factor RskA
MNTEQTPIELAKSALQQVIDYREGNGKFNLSHIADPEQRQNEAIELWYQVESDVVWALNQLNNL